MLNDILRKKRKSKMRKPEYPVFLTYGPIHVSPLGWIKRWKEDIICICQRLRYGYCYRDAWAIDQWFLVIIPNMLNDLRINGHGYPGSFTGTEEDNRISNGAVKGRIITADLTGTWSANGKNNEFHASVTNVNENDDLAKEFIKGLNNASSYIGDDNGLFLYYNPAGSQQTYVLAFHVQR